VREHLAASGSARWTRRSGRRAPRHAPRRRALEGQRARPRAAPARAGPAGRRTAALHHPQDHGLDKALDHELMHLAATRSSTAPRCAHDVRPQRQPHRRHDARLRGDAPLRRRGPARRHDRRDLNGSAGSRSARSCPRRHAPAGRRRQRLRRQGLSGGDVVRPDRAGLRRRAQRRRGNVSCTAPPPAGFRAVVGERFCGANSGASGVVECVGDHGCEYMTGGARLILGRTGATSRRACPGVAYVLTRVSRSTRMVELEPLDDARPPGCGRCHRTRRGDGSTVAGPAARLGTRGRFTR
jgi:glutamate synthase domain-containing protein 3